MKEIPIFALAQVMFCKNYNCKMQIRFLSGSILERWNGMRGEKNEKVRENRKKVLAWM